MLTNRIRTHYAYAKSTCPRADRRHPGRASSSCRPSSSHRPPSGNGNSIRPPTNKRAAPPPCRAIIADSSPSGTSALIQRADSRGALARPVANSTVLGRLSRSEAQPPAFGLPPAFRVSVLHGLSRAHRCCLPRRALRVTMSADATCRAAPTRQPIASFDARLAAG